MKFKHLLLVAASILFIQGCDEIDGPYGVTNNGGIDTSDNIVRKVLVEDFTGHVCQACPNAHREAKRLHNLFGEQLVIIAIHADYWADPQRAQSTLNWQATKSIDDMCQDTWRWQSQNPNGYP